MSDPIVFYIIIVLLMSLFAFFLYWIDKQKAKDNQWRIKEHTLLSVSVIFGALGALLAMYKLRHKNRKWYFILINWFSLLIHIAIGILIGIGVI